MNEVTIEDMLKVDNANLPKEHPMLNDLSTYTDIFGITHIRVVDASKEYKLVKGEWVKQPVF